MLIDFHTHIFPEKIAAKTLELLAGALLLPSVHGRYARRASFIDERSGGRHLRRASRSNEAVAVRFDKRFRRRGKQNPGAYLLRAGIHPDCENPEEKLDFLAGAGFRGIKLHPDYQGVYIDDGRYIRIIRHAVSLGLCVVLHSGVDVGLPDPVHCPPERAARMLDAVYPDGKIEKPLIVFAHSGGYQMTGQVKKYLCGKNVWFDLAYTLGKYDAETSLDIIRAHGADRILFATDSPWSPQPEDAAKLLRLGLTEEEEELIRWKNAAGLLGLTEDELKIKAAAVR